jgi:hypothetical protein
MRARKPMGLDGAADLHRYVGIRVRNPGQMPGLREAIFNESIAEYRRAGIPARAPNSVARNGSLFGGRSVYRRRRRD